MIQVSLLTIDDSVIVIITFIKKLIKVLGDSHSKPFNLVMLSDIFALVFCSDVDYYVTALFRLLEVEGQVHPTQDPEEYIQS